MPEAALGRAPRWGASAAGAAALWFLCSLVACGGSSSGPTTPSAPSPSASTSACRTFSAPGSYTLDADIGVPGGIISNCLTITTSDVSVDCARHAVNGDVTISSGVSAVSIVNCVIPDYVANVTNVRNLTIANSILSNSLVIESSQSTIVRGNQLSTKRRERAVLVFFGGSDNQVLDNVLDGGYHGHDLSGQGNDASDGADDGLLLDNEAADTVEGNTVMNVYDAGIEGIDSVTRTTIAGNTMTRAIVTGIASYWCTHWQGDTIFANTVSESVQAILVNYNIGRCAQSPGPPGQFADNTIAGNVLRSQLLSGYPGISIALTSIGDMVNNNVMRDNDVGSANIFVLPLSGFKNGGGNICGANGNFRC